MPVCSNVSEHALGPKELSSMVYAILCESRLRAILSLSDMVILSKLLLLDPALVYRCS